MRKLRLFLVHIKRAFSLFSFSKMSKYRNDYITTWDCALLYMTTKAIIIKIGKKVQIFGPTWKFFHPPSPPTVLSWLRPCSRCSSSSLWSWERHFQNIKILNNNKKKAKAKQEKLSPFNGFIDQQSVEVMEWSITVSACRKITSFYLRFNHFMVYLVTNKRQNIILA